MNPGFVLINLPPPKLEQIKSYSFNPGERIENFTRTQLRVSSIPEDFQQSLNTVNTLREQLRTTPELSEDQFQLFADYVYGIKTITSGYDISNTCANVSFKWNETSLTSLEFEIYCMGYNICIGLLKHASFLRFSSEQVLHELFNYIQTTKAIIDKVEEVYNESFEEVIPRENILYIQQLLEAYNAHFQVGTIVLKRGKASLLARAAITASEQYKNRLINNQLYVDYFTILAYINMADFKLQSQEYGNGISYGNAAEAIIPAENKKNKATQEIRKVLLPLFDSFRPKLEEAKAENSKLYFDQIPPSPPAISPIPTRPIATKYSWECSSKIVSHQATASSNVSDFLNQHNQIISSSTSKALQDIDQALALYPYNEANEIQGIFNDLNAKRTYIRDQMNRIGSILNQKGFQINQYCPQVFNQYNQLVSFLGQASKTDLFYETQYAKTKSYIQPMEDILNPLNQRKIEVTNIVQQAQKIIDDTQKAIDGQTNMKYVLEIQNKAQNDLNSLISCLNPVLQEVAQHVSLMREINEKSITFYHSEIASVKCGFTQGVDCYNKIINNINLINQSISGFQ